MATKNPWTRFWAWYFLPREFERWREGRAYELIGIRTFKHYLPTTGDLVSKWWGTRWVSWRGSRTSQGLSAHEHRTRNWEARHIFGFLSMLALTWLSIEIYGKGSWVALLVANLLINGYPIMLQRYNRVRIQAVLLGLSKRSGRVAEYSAQHSDATLNKSLERTHEG